MKCIRDTYVGAITALVYSPDEKYILYGSGKSVWIYDSQSYKEIVTFPALASAAIHGIRFNNDIVCIFGQKELTLYRWSELVESHFQTIQPIYQYDHFIDWIWDVCFVDKSTNDFSKLAIGTFHNAVILWNTEINEPIECYYGKERCILYSMSIINLHGDFLVASGTVFSEVHIWSVHHPEKTHICKKHNGVIFKVRWNEDGRCLLSVSDDRSVILWKHSSSTEPWWVSQPTSISTFLNGSYEVAMQCYGHTARLWDCLFTPYCIITCSEDCTVRFWDADGTCIGTFTGHEGKHIWCIAYSETQQIVLTGGNDNSIKIWNLNDILNSNLNTTISTAIIPTMRDHDMNEPRNSKSECIRELFASEDGQSIMVISNWGYLWNYDIREKKWNSIYTPEEHQSVSCMEVGKNGIVVVGKMDGSIQFISINQSSPSQEFHPCNHRITKILLDEENDEYSRVFLLTADSIIHVCKYFNKTNELIKQTSIPLQGKSVAIALAWIHSLQLLCVSDSIGCVTFFHLQESETIEVKESMTLRCHGHVPVTCLAWKDDCLWTGGNDGRIVALEVSVTPLNVTPQTPLIVPKIKQVLSMWWNDEDQLFCAGYQERLYYVYDLTSMVEVLTISAGGWKRPSTSASHPQHPNRGYTYAYASMNGFSEICVYSKEFAELSSSLPSINQVSHGREINVTHWLTRTEEGGILLTGGEDRKMQVVEVKRRETTFDWIIHHSFEVHSSSIRCITSCKCQKKPGFLAFSCGGRSTICIWRIEEEEWKCVLKLTYPHRNASNCISEGDQRILAVSVIPSNDQSDCYYLFTGDSCGMMHIFCYNESTNMLTLITRYCLHSTPILSAQFYQTETRVGIVAGVAAGDLICIDLSEMLKKKEEKQEVIASTVFSFKAIHIMGINDLKVIVEGEKLHCVSVGEDQSLQVTSLQWQEQEYKCLKRVNCGLISGTSLRSVAVVKNHVFTTGWEQKVQEWIWKDETLEKLGEMKIQVPETGSIDCIADDQTVLCCVGGDMGFEVFESVL